jgi:hypothetical protein
MNDTCHVQSSKKDFYLSAPSSFWCTPKFLDRLQWEFEVELAERLKVGARSLARDTFKGRGAC